MPTNRSRPETRDADSRRSVEFYHEWYLRVAPEVFRGERVKAAEEIDSVWEHRAADLEALGL